MKGHFGKKFKMKSSKKGLEPRKQCMLFLINQTFLQTQENQGSQLWHSMPVMINSRNEVIGSVVYEEYGTDDL